MAPGTVSQHEMDRVAVAPPLSATPHDAQLYDFRRPRRLSKERLRALEAMFEQLGRSLEGWLIGRVRAQVDLRLQSVEQFTYGEFTLSLPTPCASYLFEMTVEDAHYGVIDFSHEFADFLVDRLFGGGGGGTATPRRALTPIERMAVKVVADRVVGLLQDAWREPAPLRAAVTGFESMPEILRGAGSDDAVLVATLEVAIPQTTSLLVICLPIAVLDGLCGAPHARRVSLDAAEHETQRSRASTESMLRSARVPVAVRLPEFRITLRELARLGEGSVISTGIPTETELEVRVNGQPRFRGAAGRVGRRLAVQLREDLTGEMPTTGQKPLTHASE